MSNKEKIDIAAILKDCPSGMELNCTMYNNVTLDSVSIENDYPIKIVTKNGFSTRLTKYGQNIGLEEAKCVIFPKGKKTWEDFQRPFKDGDIIYNRLQKKICIHYLYGDGISRIRGCRYNESSKQFKKLDFPIPIVIQDYRLATKEEKEKLFDIIKANGYKWNDETKTLEKLIKPKFKVGDKIIKNEGIRIFDVVLVTSEYYTIQGFGSVYEIPIKEQGNFRLIHNKFDINTLKTFDKVLVRFANDGVWMPKFFSYYNPKMKHYPFVTIENLGYPQCIPYNGNEYLCRTTNTCEEYYKTW